jgi:hypothetical protein
MKILGVHLDRRYPFEMTEPIEWSVTNIAAPKSIPLREKGVARVGRMSF